MPHYKYKYAFLAYCDLRHVLRVMLFVVAAVSMGILIGLAAIAVILLLLVSMICIEWFVCMRKSLRSIC
jgi:hypothetical protein